MTRPWLLLVLAACAPLDVVLVELPDAGSSVCRNNQDCNAEAFCAKQEHVCEGLGRCTPKAPSACLAGDRAKPAPECGCDGVTYFNECASSAAGVSVDHPGPCREPPGRCGGSCVAPAVCLGCDGPAEVCSSLPEDCAEVRVRSCVDQQCIDLCTALSAHQRFGVDPSCH